MDYELAQMRHKELLEQAVSPESAEDFMRMIEDGLKPGIDSYTSVVSQDGVEYIISTNSFMPGAIVTDISRKKDGEDDYYEKEFSSPHKALEDFVLPSGKCLIDLWNEVKVAIEPYAM